MWRKNSKNALIRQKFQMRTKEKPTKKPLKDAGAEPPHGASALKKARKSKGAGKALKRAASADKTPPYCGIPTDRKLVLSVLHKISRILVTVPDVHELLREVLDILCTQMGLSRATVTLRNGDALVITASHGLSDEEMRRGFYRMGEGVTGRVAETGKSIIVPDISKSADFLNRTQSRQINSRTAFLCVPIKREGNLIGTLSIDRFDPTEQTLQTDVKLLETVANLIAEAVGVILAQRRENEKLSKQNQRLRQKLQTQLHPKSPIGTSASIIKTYEQLQRAGESTSHILIRGEYGAGKDFAMRVIASSPIWRDKRVETLDCSTLSDSVIDAKLFGTDGYESSAGALERVGDGIVYLDAMGLIGKPLQLKLLKFMKYATFKKVGSDTEIQSKARIIASTAGDLEARVGDGIVRQDFYYFFAGSTIFIPPLRKRRRDIPALAKYFMRKHASLRQKKVTDISDGAMGMLCAYHWPSNVRELENCIERAVIISAGPVICESDLPPSLQTPQSTNTSKFRDEGSIDFQKMVGEFERDLIVEALVANGGNAAAAARSLSVSRRIFNYKTAKLGITPKTYRSRLK